MNTFPILMAYRNGALEQMIQTKASEYLARWPNWNQAAAVGIAAAYFARLGMAENESLTREARRSDKAVDDLFWWLKEDAPANVVGYIAEISGNRSLLIDMKEYDAIMANLEQMDWSEQARVDRMIAPTRKASQEYHRDLTNS